MFTQPFIQAQIKKTPTLRVTALCSWNSPVTGDFPAQNASNAEKVSIWWRHHDILSFQNILPFQSQEIVPRICHCHRHWSIMFNLVGILEVNACAVSRLYCNHINISMGHFVNLSLVNFEQLYDFLPMAHEILSRYGPYKYTCQHPLFYYIFQCFYLK